MYATFYKEKYFVNAYAGGGYNTYDASRSALQGVARGSTQSSEFDTFLEGGYEAHVGDFTYGPIGALNYTYVNLDGYTENGSLVPLKFPSQNQDSLRTNLGMKGSYLLQAGRVGIVPQLGASWQHEFDYSAIPFDSQFANGTGSTFRVFGPHIGHDSALINAGVNIVWSPTFTTYVDYDGKFNPSYQSNTISGGAQLNF